ncbi:MAG: hypothetical protein ACLFPX_06695 [Candidatus Omnitrophota bacterium]
MGCIRRRGSAAAVLALGLLSFSLSGCVYVVVGSLGAIGGYVVSPDTVEGVVSDRSQADVFRAALDVVGQMGLVEEQSEAAGVILATVNKAKVQVSVFYLSQSAVKVAVKARRSFFPKIKVAQDVYVKIMNRLQ